MSQVRRTLSSVALPLVAAWALGVACYEEPPFPKLGYETDDIACSDSTDNDGDCLVDCEDLDCLELSTVCGELIPEVPVDTPEDPLFACPTVTLADGTEQRDCAQNLPLCRDFIDNDLNGQFDCGDEKCRNVFETRCLREVTNELCSDGIDNDQNGFADCADFGCTLSSLVDACDEGELRVSDDGTKRLGADDGACFDGIDSDNDGKVDCEDDCDFRCSPSFEELEAAGIVDDPDLDYEFCCEFLGVSDPGSCAHSVACGSREADAAACGNGLDDDEDGFVDCADYDCLRSDDPEVALLCDDMEITLAECTDGTDNDRDGDVDCVDRECGQNPDPAIRDHCNGLEASVTQCSDGVDNDDNGFVDCEDFGCSMSEDPAVLDLCTGSGASAGGRGLGLPPGRGGAGGSENTLETCGNGLDDDDDGFTDCADFDCSMSPDPAILELCESQEEDSVETCSDGEDNDQDGYTDCADFSCSMSEDPEVAALCEAQEESTLEECSNGIDDDEDGFLDCADFSCSMSEDPEVAALCEEQDESTLEECTNGLDDDDDGFTDCADFSCSMNDDPAVVEACADKLENTPANCSDGIDNDGNGFIDCQDFGCTQADDFAVQQVCRESLGLSNAETDQRCSDGLDNDFDGFIDCDDFECSHNAEVSVCPKLSTCETGRE